MRDLTTVEGVLEALRKTQSETEWNAVCDEVKKANGGYPGFWFEKVNRSGEMSRVMRTWKTPTPTLGKDR